MASLNKERTDLLAGIHIRIFTGIEAILQDVERKEKADIDGARTLA